MIRVLLILLLSWTMAKGQTLDTSFKPIFDEQGVIYDLAVQPDGNILVGGFLDKYNGVASASIVRLKPDGSMDPIFNPGAGARFDGRPGEVTDIRLQPDGKILVAGFFNTFNGVAANGIARLNTNGTFDLSFTTGSLPTSTIFRGGLTNLQTDGRIIFLRTESTGAQKIIRLNSSGSIDPSFLSGVGIIPNTNTAVFDIALLSTGKVLVCGQFSSYNGTNAGNIVRLNSDGTVDNTFQIGIGSDNTIRRMRIQPDGKIILAGGFTKINNIAKFFMARINNDGTVDQSFSASSSSINDIIFETNGNLLTAGDKLTVNRLDVNGAFLSNYSGLNEINNRFNRIVRLGNGKILAAGSTLSSQGRNLVLLNDDLTVDNSWALATGVTTLGKPNIILPQADGKILMLGAFKYFDSQEKNQIVRLNSDLTLDVSLQSGSGFYNRSFFSYAEQQSDGKIIIHGQPTKYNNDNIGQISRLNLDGTLDNSYNPVLPHIQGSVLTLDDKLIIYSEFLTLGSQKFIARFTPDGNQDLGFLPVFDAAPRQILPTKNGKYMARGNFKKINNIDVGILAKLNLDGTLDNTFVSKLDLISSIYSMAETPEGKILINGLLGVKDSNSNNINYFSLMRIKENGEIDESFDAFSTSTGSVAGFAQLKDGSILIRSFENELMRLTPDGKKITNFTLQKFDSDFSITSITATSFMAAGGFTKINNLNFSSVAKFTVPQLPSRPVAPSALNGMVTENNISISWVDNAINEDGFVIERLEGTTFKKVGEVAADVTTFEDKDLSFETSYKYRVRAFNDGGFSSYSPEFSVETVTGVREATNLLTAYPNPSNGIFRVEWNAELLIQEIKVFDLMGRIIHAYSEPLSPVVFNIQNESSGIYLIKINDSKKSHIVRMVRR